MWNESIFRLVVKNDRVIGYIRSLRFIQRNSSGRFHCIEQQRRNFLRNIGTLRCKSTKRQNVPSYVFIRKRSSHRNDPARNPTGVPLSDIERLDKERELVGMYLSAHPLDAYKLELLYGCNTRMTDLKDRESLLNKELTFGGVVVDYRTGIGKRGGQYGFLKIEDYSGAEDIPLFGQDFIDYGKYGANNGTFVWIRARCQPSKFTPGRIDLKILEIKLLSELKGTLLNSITIELPARLVKNGFIQTLSEFMPPAHQHKAELSFKIYDSELDKSVRLRSRRKPTITEELIDFLSENDEVSFKINE